MPTLLEACYCAVVFVIIVGAVSSPMWLVALYELMREE